MELQLVLVEKLEIDLQEEKVLFHLLEQQFI
jgi:hypothetical protein